MPVYKLAAHVTVSAYTTVEAPDEEAAIEIAADRDVVIGGPGTGQEEAQSWVIDDADGSPENIHLSHDHEEDNAGGE